MEKYANIKLVCKILFCFVCQLEVQSPPGTVAGYVVQNWDPFLPKFTIKNESKEDVLKIIGPYATCGCFEDVDFEVCYL